MSHTMHMIWRWILPGGIALCLAGCQSLAQPETIGASTSVVNTVLGTTIVRASFNGYGIAPGGGEECCISLPKQWQPGMTANISWIVDPSPGVNPGGVKEPKWNPDGTTSLAWKQWMATHKANYKQHQKRVLVPKYQRISSLILVFLPCDEVYPLIDAEEQGRVLGGLRYFSSKEWDLEVIRRLGGKQTCPQK